MASIQQGRFVSASGGIQMQHKYAAWLVHTCLSWYVGEMSCLNAPIASALSTPVTRDPVKALAAIPRY